MEQIDSGRGVSALVLKMAAIAAMTCNHAGNVFAGAMPDVLQCVLVAVGGITFPIMAFLLSDGCVHTSNAGRYALRLLAFACISQVPYMFTMSVRPNVLFTLLAGLACVQLWKAGRIPVAVRAVGCAAICLASYPFDWGFVGPAMCLAAYILADAGLARAVMCCGLGGAWGLIVHTLPDALSGVVLMEWLPYCCFYVVCVVAAIPLLAVYDGTRGRWPLKWFFYAYYPAHLMVLLAVGLVTGVLT